MIQTFLFVKASAYLCMAPVSTGNCLCLSKWQDDDDNDDDNRL